VVDADDFEQPEKELAMASLWPVPDALGGCSEEPAVALAEFVGVGVGVPALVDGGAWAAEIELDDFTALSGRAAGR
jgi:hypothetical protein